MSKLDSNPSNKISIKKAQESRSPFLMVDIPIWDNLSPYALKVYGQLRKLIDFREQHDEAHVTVESLAIKSNISERKTYQVLNELEKDHFLIKKITNNVYKRSNRNSYDVAQTYGFFNPNYVQQAASRAEKSALYADQYAPNAEQSAYNAVPIDQHSSQQSYQHVCGEADASTAHTTNHNRQSKAEETALKCEDVQRLFNLKFSGRSVTLEQIFIDCKNHYDQKGTWVTKRKLLQWLEREKPDNYIKQDSHEAKQQKVASMFTEEENHLMLEALHARRVEKLGQDINLFITPEKLARAEELFARAKPQETIHHHTKPNTPKHSQTAPRVTRENGIQSMRDIMRGLPQTA